MAWIKLNNVYMNSTSSTSTYTYTTTTTVSTDRYTTTYNNTLSSGTFARSSYYNVMNAKGSYDWDGCPYSGDTFTIGSRGMSLSISKNTSLTSNNTFTESIAYNKYTTLAVGSWYDSFSSDSNSNFVTSRDIGEMYYDPLIELDENTSYSMSVTAGTFSKTINDFFKQNCSSRKIQETISVNYTYTYKSQISTIRGTFTTTLTVGYGTNTHTESYGDKRYTNSVSFTQSSSSGYWWDSTIPYHRFSNHMITSIWWGYYDTYMITMTTSYCRTSTNIFTNTTSITTLTSTR